MKNTWESQQIRNLIERLLPDFQGIRKDLEAYIVYVARAVSATPLKQVEQRSCHTADASRKD